MIDIVIEYPYMHFKRNAIGKVPTSWAELSERQFIAITKVIDGAEPDYIFLAIMTGINKELLKRLTAYEILKLSEGIDFVGKSGSFYHDFIIKEIPSKNLISPKPKLSGLTFGQFMFADAYYNDWNLLFNETALNKFIATLYLMPDEKFNPENTNKRTEMIESLNINLRKAIALNYALITVWLQKAYPLIFVENDTSQSKEVSPQPQSSGWLNLFDSMVGDDLINRDRYADLPIHDVFRYLTKKFKENARK